MELNKKIYSIINETKKLHIIKDIELIKNKYKQYTSYLEEYKDSNEYKPLEENFPYTEEAIWIINDLINASKKGIDVVCTQYPENVYRYDGFECYDCIKQYANFYWDEEKGNYYLNCSFKDEFKPFLELIK